MEDLGQGSHKMEVKEQRHGDEKNSKVVKKKVRYMAKENTDGKKI